MRFHLPFLFFATLATGQTSQAQELLESWTFPGGRLGRALHLLPDTDGDGQPEFLIGQFDYRRASMSVGRAFVMRSSDGSVPFEIEGTVASQKLGGGLGSVGDVNGDGFADHGISSFLYPAGPVPQLQIFSGKDLSLLYERSHPAIGMETLGDLNGDGRDDFLLGDPIYGVVSLIHGGTFEVVREWNSTGGPLGQSLAVLGEIDGDGHPDFAAGAPGAGSPVGTWPGKVEVFSSGKSGRLLEYQGEGVTEQYGLSLASPGDLNGDGFGELVVAGPGCCTQYNEDQGPGRLYFYDVHNNLLLGTSDPAPGERGFGLTLDEAGDVDGNGVGDVLAFMSTSRSLNVDIIEGATRQRIGRVAGSDAFSGDRDWNGDTIPDITSLWPGGASAEIRVYSGAPVGVRVLGTPCAPGPEPRIGCTASARLGLELPVHLSNVAPGRSAALVLGEPETFAQPGACHPRLRALQTLWRRTTAVSPGKGAATVRLFVPNDASLQGRTFYAQWILPGRSTQPQATSRVLAVEIQ